MDISQLRERLPDAPPWFWDCNICCHDPMSHTHVKEWEKDLHRWPSYKTLWEACRPFFAHSHFEDGHSRYPFHIKMSRTSEPRVHVERPLPPAPRQKQHVPTPGWRRYLKAERNVVGLEMIEERKEARAEVMALVKECIERAGGFPSDLSPVLGVATHDIYRWRAGAFPPPEMIETMKRYIGKVS